MQQSNNNDNSDNDQFRRIIAGAEHILRHTYGERITLERMEQITEAGRLNPVMRCRVLDGPEDAPGTVIIKSARTNAESLPWLYDPDNPDSRSAMDLFNEWAGLQFLNTLQSAIPLAPRFYGGNREEGFILLEDLGGARTLVQPLLEGGAVEAEAALMQYMTTLARIHALSNGKTGEYVRIRRSLGPLPQYTADHMSTAKELRESTGMLREPLAVLGVDLQAGYIAEVEALAQRSEDAQSLLAYIHNDPCPDNCLFVDTTLRLIDFAVAATGNPLLDAVYGRMMFPTCWCANKIPEPVWRKMEAVYHAELLAGLDGPVDEALFRQATIDACAVWLIRTLTRQLKVVLEQDREWGIATVRPRIISRLDAFIAACDEFGALPEMRRMGIGLRAELGEHWPDVSGLPLYPAFRIEYTE